MTRMNIPTSADYAHVQTIAQQVARIVARIVPDSSIRVLLFGSWADGTPRLHSDIDLAIDGGPVTASQMTDIRDACDRMSTLYTVDLVDLARAAAEFRDQVRRQARVVIP